MTIEASRIHIFTSAKLTAVESWHIPLRGMNQPDIA
jgi:hypothetical protein